MQHLLNDVLATIKPSRQEEREVRVHITTFLKQLKLSNPVGLGGSAAKHTWLKGNHDVDLFVKYPKKAQHISDDLHKRLKALKIPHVRLHGSRDYFQTTYQGYQFELIPIHTIRKAQEAENITDVSPLHATWVRKHKQYVDDIRLAKQFCKAADVYGAESYIKGFSGYVLEVLTIHYKGFKKFIKAASTWKPQVIIDTAKHHNNVLFEVNVDKLQGPLVVIDPVEAGRNAAAAVSAENFSTFVKRAKAFIRKPTWHYFTVKRLTPEQAFAKYKGYKYLYTLDLAQGKHDVVGCRIIHCLDILTKRFKEHGFTIKKAGYTWKKTIAHMYLIINDNLPSPTYIRQGPSATLTDHVKAFKRKHPTAKKVKNTWQITLERVTHMNLARALRKELAMQRGIKKVALKSR